MYYKQINAGVDPVNATMQFLRLRSFEDEKISIIAKITGYAMEKLTEIWNEMVADCDGSEDELNEQWDDFVAISFELDWGEDYGDWWTSKEGAK